jgi:hypothetical protein
MTPEYRKEILHGIRTMCQLYPSYRLCQMVANTATLAAGSPDVVLSAVPDYAFLQAMTESLRQRRDRLEGQPAPRYDGDTLPEFLSDILRGLEALSEQYPDKPFVPLVLQVAEWSKEFAPFDFWDVEDADFLRAIQAHQVPSAAAP